MQNTLVMKLGVTTENPMKKVFPFRRKKDLLAKK